MSISLLYIHTVNTDAIDHTSEKEMIKVGIPRLLLRASYIERLELALFTCARRHPCYWDCVDADVDEMVYAVRRETSLG